MIHGLLTYLCIALRVRVHFNEVKTVLDGRWQSQCMILVMESR